jgi:hypothetical protein
VRTRLAALVAAAALAGLTACGTELSPDVHPGAAAVVGGTTISLEEVDELATDLCSVDRAARESAGEAGALGFYRSLAVQNLGDYELARQYADEHGLEPVPELESRLEQGRQQLLQRGASPETAEILLDFERRSSYRDAVLAATGDPQAAQEDYSAWVEDVDITVDPRFGSVDLTSGEYTPPSGLSTRVTDIDPQDAGELPADQRCG